MLDFSNYPSLEKNPCSRLHCLTQKADGSHKRGGSKKEYEFNLRRPREEKGGKVVVKASLCGRRSGSKNRM